MSGSDDARPAALGRTDQAKTCNHQRPACRFWHDSGKADVIKREIIAASERIRIDDPQIERSRCAAIISATGADPLTNAAQREIVDSCEATAIIDLERQFGKIGRCLIGVAVQIGGKGREIILGESCDTNSLSPNCARQAGTIGNQVKPCRIKCVVAKTRLGKVRVDRVRINRLASFGKRPAIAARRGVGIIRGQTRVVGAEIAVGNQICGSGRDGHQHRSGKNQRLHGNNSPTNNTGNKNCPAKFVPKNES
jgi:hypothetical protein